MRQRLCGGRSVQGRTAALEHIRAEKRQLRKAYKEIRAGIFPERKLAKESRMKAAFLESFCYKYGKKLLVYAATGSEADTFGIASRALADGKAVYFPKVYDGGKMRFFRVTDTDELQRGAFGIPEPSEDAEEYTVSENGTDICIVPGLCFDKSGYRIGYGKGFYDRFLASFKGVSIGLSFAECICEEALPREKRYDKHVDFVITDKEMMAVVD